MLTAAGLLIVSLAIVLYARTRPGYDPYGWLVWGKLTIHLKLDTNGAPSWKPLPYLFTVPYALVGRYALWLWMVTSVAISLSGLIFAWRIAFRLTYSRPERRYASYVAGLFAAAFVLAMQDPVGNYNYTHYILSAESDTMIVSLCLLAVDLHLSGHHKAAFWIWWLGVARTARGVAVLRARRAVAVAEVPCVPALAVRVGGAARVPVVRDPGPDLQEPADRRQHRRELAAGDPRQQDHRHDRPLPRAAAEHGLGAGGADGGVGGVAPADRDPGARRRERCCGC